MPQVIYKPHCHYQNFSPLANRVYLTAMINETPWKLSKWEYIAHTVGLGELVNILFFGLFGMSLGPMEILAIYQMVVLFYSFFRHFCL